MASVEIFDHYFMDNLVFDCIIRVTDCSDRAFRFLDHFPGASKVALDLPLHCMHS